jgi:formate/nitrite transporter
MAISSSEILDIINKAGIHKAERSAAKTLVSALMAGAYIAFAAYLATLSLTGWSFNGTGFLYGPSKILFGAVFSVGLMLVVIAGADLFTGNILLTIPLVRGDISYKQTLRNWALVWIGNFAGSLFFAWLVTGPGNLLGGEVEETAVKIARAKADLPVAAMLVRSILANWIVCLAVVMAAASEKVSGKILAIFFPIMGFAAGGFEHSIANMYFIPAGILVELFKGGAGQGVISITGAVVNIAVTTVGNIIGGALLVAGAYEFLNRKEK